MNLYQIREKKQHQETDRKVPAFDLVLWLKMAIAGGLMAPEEQEIIIREGKNDVFILGVIEKEVTLAVGRKGDAYRSPIPFG